MNRFLLVGFLLLACPGEEPATATSPKASPALTTEVPAPTGEANDSAACGASVLDEGCGDEVTLCGDGDPPQDAPGQP